MAYNCYIPTRVLFGAGRLNDLHAQAMPVKNAMAVISNGKSSRTNGALSRTEEQLHLAGVQTVLFDQMEATPLKSTVEAGALLAEKNKCDFVVALGGGSDLEAREHTAFANNMSGSFHGGWLLHQRALYGTRHECLSSETAPWRGTNYDF